MGHTYEIYVWTAECNNGLYTSKYVYTWGGESLLLALWQMFKLRKGNCIKLEWRP